MSEYLRRAMEKLRERETSRQVDPEELERQVEARRREMAAGFLAPLAAVYADVPLPAWRLLRKLHAVIAVAAGILVAFLVLGWINAHIRGEMGFGGLVYLLGAFIAGIIGGGLWVLVLGLVVRLKPTWGALALFDLLTIAAIWFGLVQPMQGIIRHPTPPRLSAQPMAPTLPYVQETPGSELTPLRQPSMLDVDDRGTTVLLTNTSAEPIFVGLARVRRNAAAAGGWEGCRMAPAGEGAVSLRWEQFAGGVRYAYDMAPGLMLAFVLHGDCAGEYADAALEYRVGSRETHGSWWSESALAASVHDYQLAPDPAEDE